MKVPERHASAFHFEMEPDLLVADYGILATKSVTLVEISKISDVGFSFRKRRTSCGHA
jgi:hypothetical protein